MCGILGVIGNVDQNKFESALDRLEHRGPDGKGTWNNEDITLGHRRLSIIDLSDSANQPMEYLDKYILVFNGEIYNYIELKNELISYGYNFRTNSDTEVLLAAFDKWQEKCLNKLNGMWAFALWDKSKKSLFLSRDRIGKKPLFFSQKKSKFIFASEMKAISPFLNEIEVNHKLLDKAKLDLFCYESTDECLISGINRFPAGSYGILKNGNLKIKKFWDIKLNDSLWNIPYKKLVEQFHDLFMDACKLRMRSDAPFGSALSGGLDSSSVIAAMSEIKKSSSVNSGMWHNSFVASFPGSDLDETYYAQKVADHCNVELQQIDANINFDPDTILKELYMFEELYYTPPYSFIKLYKNLRDSGLKVTMDGHGADELFGGYPFDVKYKLADTLYNPIKNFEVSKILSEMSNEPFNIRRMLQGLKEGFRLRKENSSFRKEGYLNHKLLDSSLNTYLPTILRNFDRFSMISSIEIRMPFLDYRIIEFAFSINADSKVGGGYSKRIIRDAMKNYLPKEITHRKRKIGFNSPVNSWISGEFGTWIKDTINTEDFRTSSVIDGPKSKNKIQSLLNSENLNFVDGMDVWKELVPYLWEKSLSYN